jgi:hypothetical protein
VGIIGFLLDNLLLLAVAVGLLYALFFRRSPIERPPNRMPDFGGGGFPLPGHPERRREPRPAGRREPGPAPRAETPRPPREMPRPHPEPARPVAAPPERPVYVPRTSAAAQRQAPSAKAAPAPEYDAPLRVPEAPPLPPAPAASAVAARNTRPPGAGGTSGERPEAFGSAEDLRRAFLWAEILGPPRARRPFRFR